MQTNNILRASLIDIIFDGRNKEYGAYELRRTYERRIKKSLLITASIAALAFGGAVLGNSLKKNSPPVHIGSEVILTDVDDMKKPDPIPPPEEKPQEPEQVKTEKLTPPLIVEDEKMDQPPPSQKDFEDAQIGLDKKDGIPDNGIEKPEIVSDPKGIITEKVEKENDDPLSFVQIEAKFIGNWEKFLMKNLSGDVAVENNAPPGRYSVVIRFVVDTEGNVSDIIALTNHGYGLEEEALRVIRKATKWEPAIQNGYKAKAYRKQVIVFDVQDPE